MAKKNKIEKLADEIFQAVKTSAKDVDIAFTNRLISFDFATIFKLTALDYTSDCVLVERLFLKQACEVKTIKMEVPAPSMNKIKDEMGEIMLKLAGKMDDADRVSAMDKLNKLAVKYANGERELKDQDLLTYEISGGTSPIIVSEFNNKTKDTYQYFCYQMALFVFNYFTMMKMYTFDAIEIDVIPVVGVDCVDILCKLKEQI